MKQQKEFPIFQLTTCWVVVLVWCHCVHCACSFGYFHVSMMNINSSRGRYPPFLSIPNNLRNRFPYKNSLRFASPSEAKGGNLDADRLPQKQIDDTGINFQEKGKQGNLKAPSFNGKVIYPVKAFLAGLSKQSPVAAVYAILNSEYKRG
jgi:hypothetical protein